MSRKGMYARPDVSVFCSLPLFTPCVMILVFVACAFSVCLARECLAQLAEAPWPMGLHDLQHSGCSPFKAAQTNEVRWKFQANDTIWSSPAVASDGTIYIGAHDGKLYAINSDGSLKWSYQTGRKILASPSIGADGTIYIGSYDAYFYAIKPDGALKWKFSASNSIISCAVIGADGTVCFGAYDGTFYALNPDGTVKWTFKADAKIISTPAIGADGTLYFGSTDGKVYAIGGAKGLSQTSFAGLPGQKQIP